MSNRSGAALSEISATSAVRPKSARSWVERLWASIAERGLSFAPIPAASINALERAKMLAQSLLSERGEASGAAVARELMKVVASLGADERVQFLVYLGENFQPDDKRLTEAAHNYIKSPSPQSASRLAEAAEPPRQELLRRMNMAEGGTAALVEIRKILPDITGSHPAVGLLDTDLRHLFSSWFNRGFLELRQIDWQTPAAILEKLIAYEAVHEIQGWDDLRRRLAPDRRCFAFFHPALPGEPLIFVEVALVEGLADSVRGLLELDTNLAAQCARATEADTAIFYSISNCQVGLRGISFGNFLIKQVVEELRTELPGLSQFATLSPIPGFSRWLESRFKAGKVPQLMLSAGERKVLFEAVEESGGDEATALARILAIKGWNESKEKAAAVKPVLLKLCAFYLSQSPKGLLRTDPVARFHLGNGARLERINWMGNSNDRGLQESYGFMVNYLYDPAMIESNHEEFTRDGKVARSAAVASLTEPTAIAPLLSRPNRKR
jgi:malonyl-CoA decarboxylase